MRRKATQLDQATGPVGIVGHKAREPRLRLEDVEEAASDALVKGADDGLVLVHRGAIWAVAQTDRDLIGTPVGDERPKPERGEAPLKRSRIVVGLVGSELSADFPPSVLDLAQTAVPVLERARQPAAEILICAWGAPPGLSIWGDRPGIRGTTACLPDAGSFDQPRFREPLQMQANAVRVQTEPLGELSGLHRTLELGEEGEQARSGRLREHIIGIGGQRQIDDKDFTQCPFAKQPEGVEFSHSHCGKEGGASMTYVINEPCVGVKDGSCTEVCPVDCIHPTPEEPGFAEAEQLYIDPEECIDCDACVEACPVDAITPEDQVPPDWQRYIEINAAYFRALTSGA